MLIESTSSPAEQLVLGCLQQSSLSAAVLNLLIGLTTVTV